MPAFDTVAPPIVEHDGYTATSTNRTEAELQEGLGVDTPAPDGETGAVPEPVAPAAGSGAPATVAGTPEALGTSEAPEAPEAPTPPRLAEKRKGESYQQAINRLTYERRDAERQAQALAADRDRLHAEAEALRQQQATPPPPVPTSDAEPTLNQFESYDAYIDAHGKWVRTMAVRDAEALWIKRDTERQTQDTAARARFDADQQTRAHQDLLAQHQTRLEETAKRHADFEAVTAGIEAVAHIQNADLEIDILHSPQSGELVYYFAAHPEEFAQIAMLPRALMLKAIGKLEYQLDAAQSGPAASPPPVTRAKPPIKPVGGSLQASPDVDNPEDLEFGPQYVAAMNAKDRDRQKRRRGL